MRAALSLVMLAGGLFAQPPSYDIVIAGARVIDGSGNPWYYADIGIRGDTIATVGNLSEAAAASRIDAHGLVAAPGFIDIHSHGRRAICPRPHRRELSARRRHHHHRRVPMATRRCPSRRFSITSRKTPISINFATMVGQGSIRDAVIGLANRKATPEEIDKMKALAEQAMRDGAFGLSTGLFYVPGNFTPTEEVIEIAKVVGRMGGIHISHMRDEAAHVLDSVRETIRIGEEGGLPTQITHHKMIGQASWGLSVESLKLVEEARARGVDVTIDQYPYTASSTGISALFPQWALEGGQKSLLERLAAPEQRARIKAVIVQNIKVDRGAGDPQEHSDRQLFFRPHAGGQERGRNHARGRPGADL